MYAAAGAHVIILARGKPALEAAAAEIKNVRLQQAPLAGGVLGGVLNPANNAGRERARPALRVAVRGCRG